MSAFAPSMGKAAGQQPIFGVSLSLVVTRRVVSVANRGHGPLGPALPAVRRLEVAMSAAAVNVVPSRRDRKGPSALARRSCLEAVLIRQHHPLTVLGKRSAGVVLLGARTQLQVNDFGNARLGRLARIVEQVQIVRTAVFLAVKVVLHVASMIGLPGNLSNGTGRSGKRSRAAENRTSHHGATALLGIVPQAISHFVHGRIVVVGQIVHFDLARMPAIAPSGPVLLQVIFPSVRVRMQIAAPRGHARVGETALSVHVPRGTDPSSVVLTRALVPFVQGPREATALAAQEPSVRKTVVVRRTLRIGHAVATAGKVDKDRVTVGRAVRARAATVRPLALDPPLEADQVAAGPLLAASRKEEGAHAEGTSAHLGGPGRTSVTVQIVRLANRVPRMRHERLLCRAASPGRRH